MFTFKSATSNIGDTGRPARQCDIWFNLSSRSIKWYRGDIRGAGVERKRDGWLKVWIDFETSDGLIKIYLGMVKEFDYSHAFRATDERTLFGGVEVASSLRHVELPPQLRSGFIGKSPIFTNIPSEWASRSFFCRETKVQELPEPPDLAEWHFVWGLNVRVVPGAEVIAGQTVLDLLAVPTRGRHAVCLCLSGFVPETAYRVALWAKPAAANTDVHVQLRDFTVASTGKPTHECDVWYSLSAGSVRKVAYGGMVACGIEPEPEGWFKLWADIITSDGWFYVYLGFIEARMNTNAFLGDGERLLFGGIAMKELPMAHSQSDVQSNDQRP